ncbi:MAG: hypothetical protein ACJAUL_001224 [Paraglaciecola sp.]|jgi:hypothetical protein
MITQQCIASRLLNHALISSLLLIALATKLHAADFDHRYQSYDQLLHEVVQVSDNKKQTRVNYQQLAVKQDTLAAVLISFSQVGKKQYDSWSQDQKLSFLVNAYNGFTLKLIVDNWHEFKQGDAQSIRDLGSLFTTPWEKKFFTLFDKKRSLDEIEHEMVRKWFKEPRIHAALVCAAVSCPPLRNEAFIPENLNQQLQSQMQLFLADNSRNEIRVNNGKGQGSLSPIFKWYRGDFEKGDGGFHSLFEFLSTYREALVKGDTDQQAQRGVINSKKYPIMFKDYDWRLNDVENF